jgi:hypothetical protein
VAPSIIGVVDLHKDDRKVAVNDAGATTQELVFVSFDVKLDQI